MITERTWHDLISIWQGLNKIRFALSSIHATGLQKIDQAYLDRSFPEHKFRLIISHKDQLISALKNHDSNSTLQLDESLRLELEEAKRWLEEMGDEITLDKTTDNFHYQYILKDEPSKDFLTGFIKIESLSDPSHKGLLSWQDANSPILFLAEIKAGMMFFHVNYGNEGLAIIQEQSGSYKWTHALKQEYLDLVNAPFGSVMMSEGTDQYLLLDGNLAGAKALSHAKTLGKNGKTLFENNIMLMNLYKRDLHNLFLN
jgi:hypothetical protein